MRPLPFTSEDAQKASQLGRNISLPGGIHSIVLCGMGGSAIAGHILQDYLKGDLTVPFVVNSSYTLPAFVNASTLVILVSYSGETEETLACYEEAKKRHAPTVIITSGGALKKAAQILIPPGFLPRNAFPYLFFPLLNVLQAAGLIPDKTGEIEEALTLLPRFNLALAAELAQKVAGKFPVVYASSRYAHVAYRWQTQLNENSKVLAHAHAFPELNHNEIEAWHDSPVLLLRDEADPPREQRQIDAAQELLNAEEVYLQGPSLLAKILYALLLGDHLSERLAEINKIDPAATERIRHVKKRLKETE